MSAKLALSGTYVFSFTGFDHRSTQARYVAGVGQLVLKETATGKGTITSGEQLVSNSPMTGQSTDFLHSRYALSGTYEVIQAGPPVVAMAKVTFSQSSSSDRKKMSDTFAIVQTGPDRLRLISTDPHEEPDGGAAGPPIQELVMGELIKVDMATW